MGSRRGRRGLEPPPHSDSASASVMDGRVLSEEEPRLSEGGCGQREQLMLQDSEQPAPSLSSSLHWADDAPHPLSLLPAGVKEAAPSAHLSPIQPQLHPGRPSYLGGPRGSGEAAAKALWGQRGSSHSRLPPPLVQHLLGSPIRVVGCENMESFCGFESEVPPTPTQRNPEPKVNMKSSKRHRPRCRTKAKWAQETFGE